LIFVKKPICVDFRYIFQICMVDFASCTSFTIIERTNIYAQFSALALFSVTLNCKCNNIFTKSEIQLYLVFSAKQPNRKESSEIRLLC